MNPMENLYEMQLQIYEIFKTQNPEFFDVVFEVNGKKLYAEKLRLSAISPVFKSLLSEKWISKNDAIEIESFKFGIFKQLLNFIYSGQCRLTEENAFSMVEIAEFYQIYSLKTFCDGYLSKMDLSLENVFQFLEFSTKYSGLLKLKESMKKFIFKNLYELLKSEEFLMADKFAIEQLINLNYFFLKQEKLFRAVSI
uniref:BTB domain-containing protein n=1 Tax=Panagrolaimus davidi TaxID=227884 RepID=A0A914PSV4_9BILA